MEAPNCPRHSVIETLPLGSKSPRASVGVMITASGVQGQLGTLASHLWMAEPRVPRGG